MKKLVSMLLFGATVPILVLVGTIVLWILGLAVLVALGILLIFNLIFIGSHSDITFYIHEAEDGGGNGRILELCHRDSSKIIYPNNEIYHANTPNLYCPHNMVARVDSFHMRIGACPLAVHRPTGRIDTMYTGFLDSPQVGYVSRHCTLKKWIVMECKIPGEILGHDHLSELALEQGYDTLPAYRLPMSAYTYTGQKIVFESNQVHYWIASRKTADLYGPCSEKELIRQMKGLDISLPIELDGNYDRYTRNDTDEQKPTEYYYPHHKARPNKVIMEKQ